MSLTDPTKKMSKTGGEGIMLSDSPQTIWKKLAPAVTDPARKKIIDPGNPDICNIYSFHKLLSKPEEIKLVAKNCRGAEFGCLDCKKILAKNLEMEFEDFRERRKIFESDPEKVRAILNEGAQRARQMAYETLAEVKKKMGLV